MKWYYNMKISAKLLLGFVMVAVIAGIVGVVGIINIKTVGENDTTLYEHMTAPMQEISNIAVDFQLSRINARDMVFSDNEVDVNNYYSNIEELSAQITEYADAFEATIFDDEEQSLI